MTATEEAAARVTMVTAACNASLPSRFTGGRHRRPAHWWTSEIARLRQDCILRRRRATRLRVSNRPVAERDAAYDDLREARRTLRLAIKNSKTRCWGELCELVDDQPWGKPYKLVMKKLQGTASTTSMESAFLDETVRTLFPTQPPLPAQVSVPAFQVNEVDEAEVDICFGKAGKTAPGPDGIPKKIWRIVHRLDPTMLPALFTKCLETGEFPLPWKRARLVLLKKKGRLGDEPSAYRPISLLDTIGKVLERVIAQRIGAHLEVAGDLSETQFGFRRGRSTITAIQRLLEQVRAATADGDLTVAVSLDVKNAFNSVSWPDILASLETFQVPEYLQRILRNYLQDRRLEAESADELMHWTMSCGVPQGSVLGPLLWNLSYDSLLRIALPPQVSLVCYADDVLVVVRGTSITQLETRANEALHRVSTWMDAHGLELAAEKTDAILFTGRRRGLRNPQILVNGVQVIPAPTMKYLGVVFDCRLTFRQHFVYAGSRADKVASSLGRLMPNLGGPKECRRRLLMSVVNSILVYAYPVWADKLTVKRNVETLSRAQRRGALRCVSAYRTVSRVAASVLAGIPPIDLIVAGLLEVQLAVAAGRDRRAAKDEALVGTLRTWQGRWEQPEPRDQGAWTKSLIQDVSKWCLRDRRTMKTSYRLTQMLTGHGCFNAFLHKIERADDPSCAHCASPPPDTALHTLLECPTWDQERRALVTVIGRFAVPDLVDKMLADDRYWDAVVSFCEVVMLQKEEAERLRQRRQRPP